MGWASGSRLMSAVIETLVENVTDDKARAEIYRGIIPAFENMDCDTLMECFDDDEVFVEVYRELNPDYFDDEDEEDAESDDWED